MKFLKALIKNSRQPARRSGIPTAPGQVEPLNPSSPIQQRPPVQSDALPAQVEQRPQQDDAPARKLPPGMPREASEAQPAAAHETSSPVEMTHRALDVPGGHGDQTSGQFSVETPGLDATSNSQDVGRSDTADAPHARVDVEHVEGQPASPGSRTINTPARVVTDQSVAGQPDSADPGSRAMPRQRVTAEVIAAQPAVDPGMARPEVPDMLAGSVSDPTPTQATPDHTLAENQLHGQGAGAGQVSNPQHRQQVEYSIRPLQASVQQQPAAPRNPLPRQPVRQNQARETPQVQIGQINVLVEDQAPAKPKPSKRSSRPAASNPFGLRGL